MSEIQLEWNYGGNDVKIAGSFNNWTPTQMNKYENKWIYKLNLLDNDITFKFIIDGEWKIDESQDKSEDNGNINNIIKIQIDLNQRREIVLGKISKLASDFFGEIKNFNFTFNYDNIYDFMSYTSGPYDSRYMLKKINSNEYASEDYDEAIEDFLNGLDILNDIEIKGFYTFNIITSIFIDIYGNLYIGRIYDKNGNQDTNGLFETLKPTYKEFSQELFMKPFQLGPVSITKLKYTHKIFYSKIPFDKLFSEGLYQINKKEIKLSPEEINNIKLKIFYEIKKEISKDIFDTSKMIEQIKPIVKYKIFCYKKNCTDDYDYKKYFDKDWKVFTYFDEIRRKTFELNHYINKYNIPFESFLHKSDEYLIKVINNFLKKYVGEIKYEFFENKNININYYINNCVKINKLDKGLYYNELDKELLEKQEKQKIENENLIKLKNEKKLEENRKKQEEILKQQKLNNAIKSII
jgi:hypothetical protein